MNPKYLAEFLGSAGLLLVVVGSGIMAEGLAQGNQAIALLGNSLATGAGLFALIQTFGPVSGAHFNPAVSLVETLERRLTWRELRGYLAMQVLGALVGVLLAHLIFAKKLFQLSTHARQSGPLLVSELVVSFGLLMVIGLVSRRNPAATSASVALYITAGYWCTSSTSFANPAVTLARSLTDTFAGILWTGVPGFVVAQLIGAYLAHRVLRLLTA